MHQAQVSQHILDLAAAIEALGADQLIRQPGVQEGLFQQAGLGVGAVHDGEVAGLGMLAADQGGDGVYDKGGFSAIIIGLVERDFQPIAALGEQAFWLAVRVTVNDRHGHIQDALGGAVVLLEQDHLGGRVILLEAQHVAVICAPPAVDGLVGIADGKNVAVK